MKLDHFNIREFDSPDKPGSGGLMQPSTLTLLDDARGIAGVPFKITSGYRTRRHNQDVGGVEDSAHRNGYAVDIHVPDSRTRWKILDALIKVGFNRIGIADTFIHVDNDPTKPENVIWTY